jgi:AraC-like DNA-binding protein
MSVDDAGSARRTDVSTTLPTGPNADHTDPRGSESAAVGGDHAPAQPDSGRRGGDPDPITPISETTLRRLDVSGTGIGELRRLVGRFYDDARLRTVSSSQPIAFRFASLGDDQVSLRLSTLTAGLLAEVTRTNDYVVTWFRDGDGSITARHITTEKQSGEPLVLPSAEPFALTLPAGRQNFVHLARPFLDGVATERHGGPAEPIVFSPATAPLPQASAQWRQVMASVTPAITGEDAPPLIRMEAKLSLARAVLTSFPWHTDRVPSELLTARLTRVRAAVEFLHDNAHRPITPADAAAAVGLHTRSMQSAFHHHLDLSPTEYLRRIRLDRVRRDLLEHTPDTATVSDLARAWGFGNLGRFAAAYQDRFGEKPNETLRR